MKIQHATKYRKPEYPTLDDAHRDPGLLAPIPGSWRSSPRFALLVGAGFGFRSLLADARAADATLPPEHAASQPALAPAGAHPAPTAEQGARKAASIVAPMLEDALAHDGRGAFGCVAVNPPSFMSEDEALDLIQRELKAAGFNLEESVKLENAEVVGGEPPPADKKNEEDPGSFAFRSLMKKEPFTPKNHAFDFADKGRSVYVEFISREKYQVWNPDDDSGMMSTVRSYDLSEAANKAAATLRTWQTDKPVIYAVFFDPLVSTRDWDRFSPNLQSEQQAVVSRNRATLREDASELGKEKLAAQVRAFVDFMKKEHPAR